MTDDKKELDELKTEIIGLKIRIKRIEEFYLAFPSPSDYIHDHSYSPFDGKDELFEKAVRAVAQHDRASASLIQRRLQIGYNRSARLLEQLEEAGVIAPSEGSKPHDVLVKDAEKFLKELEDNE